MPGPGPYGNKKPARYRTQKKIAFKKGALENIRKAKHKRLRIGTSR